MRRVACFEGRKIFGFLLPDSDRETPLQARLRGLIVAFAPLLSACGWNQGLLATVGPDYGIPSWPGADRWQARQPDASGVVAHHGDPADLKRWWARFDDPVLSRFLAAAQKESASVAEAGARIAEARAGLTGAEASGLPSLDSESAGNRSSFSFGGPAFLRTQYQIGLQSNWEIDLFGGIARQREAARDRLESRQASWHDARVAVAVEVANAYLDYRYCEVLVELAAADAGSRRESARLTAISGQAGLRAPADVALARASAADGHESLLRQQARCERSIKGLVALTGLAEAEVRRRLTEAPERLARLPSPPLFRLAGLPVRVLLQRPDVAAAERDMAEASANIGVEQAKRFPKLSLSGNITPTLQSMNGSALMLAQTWSLGPTLSLPLFDAGKRAADVEAARARYEASVARFRATVRTAVKEVEESLVRLNSAAERLPEARAAAAGYRASFRAAEELYHAGFGSLIDTESARRQALAAERIVAELEQEWASAWIAFYRAAGGGWEEPDESRNAAAEAPSPSD